MLTNIYCSYLDTFLDTGRLEKIRTIGKGALLYLLPTDNLCIIDMRLDGLEHCDNINEYIMQINFWRNPVIIMDANHIWERTIFLGYLSNYHKKNMNERTYVTTNMFGSRTSTWSKINTDEWTKFHQEILYTSFITFKNYTLNA